MDWQTVGTNVSRVLRQLVNIKALNTSCEIYVCSHFSSLQPIDVSRDVVELVTNKPHDAGAFDFVLVPRKPYDQLIFPNDVVVMYLGNGLSETPPHTGDMTTSAPGDLTRVMIGYVDRVARFVITDGETGATTTRYRISGTDLTKAAASTSVMFDYALSHGPDEILNAFGSNLGGVAMLTTGIPLVGTPATFARAILLGFLGYGGQFLLPKSYPVSSPMRTTLEFQIKKALLREQLLGIDKVRVDLAGALDHAAESLLEKLSSLTVPDRTVATILDLFTYVEDENIAGRAQFATVDESNTTVLSMLHEYCNEAFNEMFIDLRLSHVPGAKDEFGKSPAYVPSLVMREHPFSTCDHVLVTPPSSVWGGSSFRYLFGNVFFSTRQNPARCLRPAFSAIDVTGNISKRFIDHVVLPQSAILSEDVGFSDTDTSNYTKVYCEQWLASQPISQAGSMKELGLFPLVNKQSIEIDGLRMNEVHTAFNDWGGETYAGILGAQTVARFHLLLDHWFQWNKYYRSGTITTYLQPKIRVGTRLDIEGRDESYYIEGVQHTWVYPGAGATVLTVTRGQPRSKPFPYFPPDKIRAFSGEPKVLFSIPTNVEDDVALAGFTEVPRRTRVVEWATRAAAPTVDYVPAAAPEDVPVEKLHFDDPGPIRAAGGIILEESDFADGAIGFPDAVPYPADVLESGIGRDATPEDLRWRTAGSDVDPDAVTETVEVIATPLLEVDADRETLSIPPFYSLRLDSRFPDMHITEATRRCCDVVGDQERRAAAQRAIRALISDLRRK